MKTYVVIEDGAVVGVCSSKEKAENKVIDCVKHDAVSKNIYQDDIITGAFTGTIEEWVRAGYVSDYWFIEEWEVE